MNKLVALVTLTACTASSLALADNSRERTGPSVWVTKYNQSQYDRLSTQASSLRANLDSYNTRAMTPTSNPAVYHALKAEQSTLAAQVQSYNGSVQQFAQHNPVSLYDRPAAVAARQVRAQQDRYVMNLVASRARR